MAGHVGGASTGAREVPQEILGGGGGMQETQSWQDPAAACPLARDKAAAAMSDPEDVTDEEADGHLCEKAFCVRHWGPSAQADQPVHQPTLRCNCF